jgi:hypothetical protein
MYLLVFHHLAENSCSGCGGIFYMYQYAVYQSTQLEPQWYFLLEDMYSYMNIYTYVQI